MQPWEVLGLCALVLVIYQAIGVYRRGARQYRGYLLLLLGNLALLGWVIAEGRLTGPSGAPTVELVGGLLACGLLVLVPSLLESLARRALLAERFDRAARIAALKEVLVPGAASALEREFYHQAAEARAGRTEEVVRALRRQLVDAEPPFDEGIKERIVTVLLFGSLWREAATQFETHLAGDPTRYPALAVQMVRAYGALGDLDQAAQLLHRLEERLNPEDAVAQAVLQQARLYLLADAGALPEVEGLLGHPSFRWMRKPARERLLSTAAARARSLGNPRAPAGPPSVEPLLPIDRHLALYLEGVALRAASDLSADRRAPRLPPVTLGLIAANGLGFALFSLLCGSTESFDNLVRGGASFHPAVRAGELWRLWTAMFLHGGPAHLFFNVYGLFVLGRIVEPVLGAPRFLCVYLCAGLLGNLASAYNPAPEAQMSLGASGAVLGVMAALMVTLLARRHGRNAWPDGWRREVLWNLAVLLVIQMAVGFSIRGVDNVAHLGGLAAGAMLGRLLLPGGWLGRGRVSQLVLVAALSLLAGSAGRSLLALLREDPARTMAQLPRREVKLERITLSAPLPLTVRRGSDQTEWVVLSAVHGLEVTAAFLEDFRTPEQLLGLRMAKDNEWRQQSQGPAPEVSPVAAPEVAGWPARAAERVDGSDLLLSYARAVSPASTVMVRIVSRGEDQLGPLCLGEVRRLLASLRVDGEPR